MEKKQISFELTVFKEIDDLPEHLSILMSKAEVCRGDAYAPYSNFQVGAAILLENGEVVLGNNQENASYPSGLCAERVAIFNAGANYSSLRIQAIAISAASKHHTVKRPAAPCGNCRQSIAEYEKKQGQPIKIIMRGEKGEIYMSNSIADLLPLGFDNTFLSDT